MNKKISRRKFIQYSASIGLGALVTACNPSHLLQPTSISPLEESPEKIGTTIPPEDTGGFESGLTVPPLLTNLEMVNFLETHEIKMGETSRRMVMMTYDDDGSPSEIESILSAYRNHPGSKATFFFIGDRLEICRKSIEKIVNEGHLLGCHGWHHVNFQLLPNNKINDQFEKFMHKLNEILPGYVVQYFRLPFGAGVGDKRILKIAAEWGLQHVFWTMGSNGLIPNTYKIVLEEVKNGSIVLSHMFRYYDYYEASKIVDGLIEKGFSLETVASGIILQDRRPK